MKFHGSPQLEPGRPIYVLLSKDETHVYSLPNGEADWSYARADMELREKILRKDLKDFNYGVTTATDAITRVSNKQAELERLWEPAIKEIAKTKSLPAAFELYRKAKKKLGPHPLRFDAALREKLKI